MAKSGSYKWDAQIYNDNNSKLHKTVESMAKSTCNAIPNFFMTVGL